MKLSTKGRYGMVALVDLALQPESALTTLADISERQDISLAYLEQLFVRLRRAGLVESGARARRRLQAVAPGDRDPRLGSAGRCR